MTSEEITPKANKITVLAGKPGSKEIAPQFELFIEKSTEINDGIGMGVLSNGMPYLNQRGLALLCGVQNAHIGTISSQWNDDTKPRIQAIKAILAKLDISFENAHLEIMHKGTKHFCYPSKCAWRSWNTTRSTRA
jgi:hypothetical protein